MKTIKVSDLQPGMAFSQPVYVDGENLLVPEKIEIKAKDIERLKKWGIGEVQTDGAPLEKPKDEISSLESTGSSTVDNDQIKTLYRTSLISLMSSFQTLERRKLVEPKHFVDIVGEILPKIKTSGEEWLNFALGSNREKENLAQSSLNTMIYALDIGIQMKLPAESLEQLGLAALLHDVGMLRIPLEIRRKKENCSPRNLKSLKRIRCTPIRS